MFKTNEASPLPIGRCHKWRNLSNPSMLFEPLASKLDTIVQIYNATEAWNQAASRESLAFGIRAPMRVFNGGISTAGISRKSGELEFPPGCGNKALGWSVNRQ